MENITLGEVQQFLKLFASIITSGGIILAFALKVGKNILRNELQPFNTRIDETIKNNNKRFDELTMIVDNNDIDAVRSRIVAFENLCRMDKNFNTLKRHQFKTIFKDIDKWKAYHIKYPELNGEIDIAIESIQEHYKKEIFD